MLKFKEQDFIPLILGNDINVYSLARAFHEEYKVKSTVFGKAEKGPCYKSKLVNFYKIPHIDEKEVFLSSVNYFADRHPDKKILIIGCGDNYVRSISTYKNEFSENVIAPYLDIDVIDNIIKKENFYKMCDYFSIPYPKTQIIERTDVGNDAPFEFPLIIKASNTVDYFAHEFSGQKKVYKIKDLAEYKETVSKIYESGYSDTLIVQEFIPGDDNALRILVNYSGKDKKVQLMTLGHGVLEEHTPKGIGNLSCLYLDYDETLMDKLSRLLEAIGYTGFSNFDIKYDVRDQKYKVFELNARQARCNYYVTGAGYNLAKYLVEDYIYNVPKVIEFAKSDFLWTVIPKGVIMRYANKAELPKVKELISKKKYVNPLFYRGDLSPRRLLLILKSHFSHYIKYKKYTEE